MNTLERILQRYPDEEILIADGFDEAVIGIDTQSMRLIYSVSTCIGILMKDMSSEDAWDHFGYNVSGAYVGEQTPICRRADTHMVRRRLFLIKHISANAVQQIILLQLLLLPYSLSYLQRN